MLQLNSRKYILVSLIVLLLASCGTSNNVASNGFIQKRKYNKGWYLSPKRSNTGIATVEPRFEDANEEEVDVEQPIVTSVDKERTSVHYISENELEHQVANDLPLNETSYDKVDSEDINRLEIKKETVKKRSGEVYPTDLKDEERAALEKEARVHYWKSWMFTVLALFSVIGGIFMLISSYIFLHIVFGWALCALAILLYVLMFVQLNKAAKKMAYLEKDEGGLGAKSNQFKNLVWAHVIVGSLFSIIFFFIPLLTSILNVRKARNNYKGT